MAHMRREWSLQFDDPGLAAETEPVPHGTDVEHLTKVRRLNGQPCHLVSRTVTYSGWERHPWGEPE